MSTVHRVCVLRTLVVYKRGKPALYPFKLGISFLQLYLHAIHAYRKIIQFAIAAGCSPSVADLQGGQAPLNF